MVKDTFDYTPLDLKSEEAKEEMRASLTYWQDAWRRLKQNKFALFSLLAIVTLLLAAIIGPMVSPYNYADQNIQQINMGPSASHWFGTDILGRDIFVRVLYGARISLSIGIVVSLINLCIGVVYGGIAGLSGGKVDRIMMNVVEVLYGVPGIIYIILLMVVFKPGLTNIFIAMGISTWLGMARVVRGQILSIKEQEFVLAARTMGVDSKHILLRHLLPNTIGIIVVNITLSIPGAIFAEAFLSYIGLGVSAPMASWGVLAKDGVSLIHEYPYQLFFPAGAISLTMLAFNYLGDGLRDALDPKMRR